MFMSTSFGAHDDRDDGCHARWRHTPAGSSDQITLSETDRSHLYTFIHTGQQSARARTRAQVLLKLGEGWT
jgi:hypothetical protein